MKAGREHRVPLSCGAAEILRAARALRNRSKFVFPSARGKPLSDMTLSKLLR
jgi:integrase